MRLLVVILFNLIRIGLAPILWLRKKYRLTDTGVVQLTLEETPTDYPEKTHWIKALINKSKPKYTLHALIQLAKVLAQDKKVKGLLIIWNPLECGFAKAHALRQMILNVEQSGKRVWVYFPQGAKLLDYYAASAASNIGMPAHASLQLVGLGRKALFFGEFLNRLGIQVQVESRHEFKSAGEPFSSTQFSKPAKDNLETLYSEIVAHLTRAILERAKLAHIYKHLSKDIDAAFNAITQGPYRAARALEQGFIDFECWQDKLPQIIGVTNQPKQSKSKTHAEDLDHHENTEAQDYLKITQKPYFKSFKRRADIALVPLCGNIYDAPLYPQQAGIFTEPTQQLLEQVKDHKRFAGAIILIDSRGGSATASAHIHHAIMRLAQKKPVLALLYDYAASGGYYIATAAHAIMASPLSITGSIGVVSMRPVITQALKQLHLTQDGLLKGAHPGLLNMLGCFTQEEQKAFSQEIDSTYQEFLSVVSQGRKCSVESLDAHARGRVFLGTYAKQHQLVDELGNITNAMAWMQQKINRPIHTQPVVVSSSVSFWSRTLSSSSGYQALHPLLNNMADFMLQQKPAFYESFKL